MNAVRLFIAFKVIAIMLKLGYRLEKIINKTKPLDLFSKKLKRISRLGRNLTKTKSLYVHFQHVDIMYYFHGCFAWHYLLLAWICRVAWLAHIKYLDKNQIPTLIWCFYLQNKGESDYKLLTRFSYRVKTPSFQALIIILKKQ